jgi:hypothetical protein
MHQSTEIQAYQLHSGGTRARMAILRMIAANSRVGNMPPSLQLASWKDARHWSIDGYESAYGMLSQGMQGKTPIWYTQAGQQFRDERDAGSIIGLRHTGWYTDGGDETAIGIVSRLSHGRFLAGYRWTSNDERVYFPEVFTDEEEAARMADEHARVFAEDAQEDNARFEAMCDAEMALDGLSQKVLRLCALRNHPTLGECARADARDAIEELRTARKTFKEALDAYNGAR